MRLVKEGQITPTEDEPTQFLVFVAGDKTYEKIALENNNGSVEQYLIAATNLHWNPRSAGLFGLTAIGEIVLTLLPSVNFLASHKD